VGGGGTALIVDIRHPPHPPHQYAAALRAGGEGGRLHQCPTRRLGLGTKVVMVITLGLVRPGNLIARKDAQPAPPRPILIDQHVPVPSPASPKT
jgi:hypothetical protein